MATPKTGVAPLCLELKARPKLHSTEIIGGGSDRAETTISRPDIWEGKALKVGNIECFRPHLKLHTLPDCEFLGE